MIDPQSFFNVAAMIVVGAFGWFSRELWTAVTKLREDLAALQTLIARDYVPKADYRQDLADLKEGLQKIFDKLDGKVDK